MALALYLRYEWDYKHYVFEMEAEKILWTGPYILIVSSSFAMASSAFGIWATVAQHCRRLVLVSIRLALTPNTFYPMR